MNWFKNLFHKHKWSHYKVANEQAFSIMFGILQVDYERTCICGCTERKSSSTNPNK